MTGDAPTAAPPRCRIPGGNPGVICGCRWTAVWDPRCLTLRYQHGENPEHTLVVREVVLRGDWLCERGHLAAVEAWVERVVRHAHPEVLARGWPVQDGGGGQDDD